MSVLLAASDFAVGRELATIVLPFACGSRVSSTCLRCMVRLANDANWEVREYAAGLFATILASHLDSVLPVFRGLAKHQSTNVRRAVVVAAKYVGRERDVKQGAALLGLLGLFMDDRDSYVRNNLGPFALGDGMLRYFPRMTIELLRRCKRRLDTIVRWNIARCLGTAEARKSLAMTIDILRTLAKDPHPFVWRAVATAMKNHHRARNKIADAELRHWLSDPQREHVATRTLGLKTVVKL
jgi:HEAT repeat protein